MRWLKLDLLKINIERNKNGKTSLSLGVARRMATHFLTTEAAWPPTEEEMRKAFTSSAQATNTDS